MSSILISFNHCLKNHTCGNGVCNIESTKGVSLILLVMFSPRRLSQCSPQVSAPQAMWSTLHRVASQIPGARQFLYLSGVGVKFR